MYIIDAWKPSIVHIVSWLNEPCYPKGSSVHTPPQHTAKESTQPHQTLLRPKPNVGRGASDQRLYPGQLYSGTTPEQRALARPG